MFELSSIYVPNFTSFYNMVLWAAIDLQSTIIVKFNKWHHTFCS